MPTKTKTKPTPTSKAKPKQQPQPQQRPMDRMIRMTIRIPRSLQDYVLDVCKRRETEECGHVNTGKIFTECMIAHDPEYRALANGRR